MRVTLYDDAAKQALIVLWEASDRVCSKRLKPLLRILLPSLERHGHLKLDELVTARIGLEDINRGFEDLRAGRAIRTVVQF